MKIKNLFLTIIAIFFGLAIGQSIIFLGHKTEGVLAFLKNTEIFNIEIFKKTEKENQQEIGLGGAAVDRNQELKPNFADEIIEINLNNLTNAKSYKNNEDTVLPNLTSEVYLIADLETGEIIDSYAEKAKYQIASLTKLMTAVVALENLDLEATTTISQFAKDTYGEQGNLIVGQKITIKDLLYPLLLESSNDAAEALAESFGRNRFLKAMNKKAKDLFMNSTEFFDPSGLSSQNFSSAEDLLKLSKYIYKNHTEIFEISRLSHYTSSLNQTWYSNSRFRNDENYFGGKNGFTDEARHTLITILNLPLGENSENRKIAIILLRGEKTEQDTRKIVLYLLNNVYYK